MAQSFEAYWFEHIADHHAVTESTELLTSYLRRGLLDGETAFHSLRTAMGAAVVAQELGLELPVVTGLVVAGHTHDVGKMHHNQLYTSDKVLTEKHGFELHVRDTHAFRGYCICKHHWRTPHLIDEQVEDEDIERYATVMTLGHHMLSSLPMRRRRIVHQQDAYVRTREVTTIEVALINRDGPVLARVDVRDAMMSDRPYLRRDKNGNPRQNDPESVKRRAFEVVDKEVLPIAGLSTLQLFELLDLHQETVDYYAQQKIQEHSQE